MSFRLPAPVLLALIGLAFVTLVGLGVWQVERAGWKANLVAARNAQLAATPLASDEARALDASGLDYRLVSLTGRWDAEHLMILANRIRFGVKGENAVEPLVLPGGEAVLVDRGWYPVEQRDATLAKLKQQTSTTATGLALDASGRQASRTAAGTWTGIAPESMSVGLSYRVLPWIVVEGGLIAENAPAPTSYPAQGFERYVSDVSHVEYALTWFGLAAALVVITAVRFVIEPRRARARLEAAEGAPRP